MKTALHIILSLVIVYIFGVVCLMYGVMTGAVDANSSDMFSNSVRFIAGLLTN